MINPIVGASHGSYPPWDEQSSFFHQANEYSQGSMEKHTTHNIDHTIYSVIEEWNSAKMAATVNAFTNKKRKLDNNYNGLNKHMQFESTCGNSNWLDSTWL